MRRLLQNLKILVDYEKTYDAFLDEFITMCNIIDEEYVEIKRLEDLKKKDFVTKFDQSTMHGYDVMTGTTQSNLPRYKNPPKPPKGRIIRE